MEMQVKLEMIFAHFFISCFHISQCLCFSSASVVIFESLLLFIEMHKRLSSSKDLWFIAERNLKTFLSIFLSHHIKYIVTTMSCYPDQFTNIYANI